MAEEKHWLRKAWNFIWYDDSWASWLVNVVLAYVIIKFVVYPGLGWILATPFPVVAVVSESMEHAYTPVFQDPGGNAVYVLCGDSYSKKKSTFEWKRRISFDDYWKVCGDWYAQKGITPETFSKYPFKSGFEKGDIMVLYGTPLNEIKIGDVIVFQGGKPYPIIHRVMAKNTDQNLMGQIYFETKGDHNSQQIKDSQLDETYVPQQNLYGKAVFRIPFLGYVKIWFVDLLQMVGLYKG